jgi:transposase
VPKRSASDETVAKLTATVAELSMRIGELQAMLEKERERSAMREQELLARIDALLRKVHGKKAEKMPRPKDAIRKADKIALDKKRSDERRAANAAARAELPTEIEQHAVPAGQRPCPHCEDGGKVRPVGHGRSSVEIDYVPGYFRRRVHVQEVLACTCERHIVTAPAPVRVYDKCQYGPSFLAHLVVSKCADSMPLYRLEKAYARVGVPISRSTMNELFHRAAELLKPIYDNMCGAIRCEHVVHADETPMRMQVRRKKAYVWTFRAGKNIVYVFTKSRSGATPREVLGDSKGVLVVDAYTGYNTVLGVNGRVRAACMAHVRRKFFEALSTAPDEANQALALILDLYRVEQLAADHQRIGTVEHAISRLLFSRPRMARFIRFLRAQRDLHPPKSPFGKAVTHALKNVRALTLYLDDARIPIDNNCAENSLRVVALGRKNFMFVGDRDAGENLAVLYSIVSTCEAHGVNPYTYLTDVLVRVQSHPAARVDELRPDRWAALAPN